LKFLDFPECEPLSIIVREPFSMSHSLSLAAALAFALAAAMPSGPAAAQAGKVILQIDGVAGGGKAEFTRDDLERMGVATIRTTTPWHDGVQTFEGVPLAKLMATVGAKGEKVEVTALNRYRTEIPMADFERYGAILALKRDGKYMDVKDKGPLFVIYPFDEKPELKSEQYYGRSAWQVRSMTVQ
jgi:hypothetical protein